MTNTLLAPPPAPAHTTTGDAVTELSPTIAGLPWADGYALGKGVDAITGDLTGSALKPFPVKESTTKSSSEHYRFVQSDSDLNTEIEASASGKYNIDGITVSGSTKYLTKIKYSELAITLLATYEVQFEGYDVPDAYELTAEAHDLLDHPEQFRHAYGDYFLAGAQRRARFTAVYVCQAQSADRMDEFKASFGAEAPEVFSAEGSVRFLQAASSHNISISADLYMEGYEGTEPSGPWDPKKIMDALAWFKEHQRGVKMAALLQHYSTLVPTYPRSVNIAPHVFVDLRSLYTTVWDVRALYGSAPHVYQSRLQPEFTKLVSEVEANQSILTTDLDKRASLEQAAQILRSELGDVFDREDFYFKVRKAVATEPPKDQAIEEGNGQQTWPYGFSVYTKSPAVNIQKWEGHYSDSWHVGWREANLDFSDDKALVVGWEVVSNWNDGTNGEWKKNLDQNLLKSRASVHVKSLYDRGCDWTLRVYWVDAALYPFDDEAIAADQR